MENPEELQNFVRLLTRHQSDLRAYVVSLLPGSEEVADIVQDTNLILWQKREQFRPGTSFVAWAFTIARFHVLRHRAKLKRAGGLVFGLPLLEQFAAAPPKPVADDYLTALEDCLAKLGERQRELIDFRYARGTSLEELATRRGESPGSLRIALMRVRLALKRCIEKSLPDPA